MCACAHLQVGEVVWGDQARVIALPTAGNDDSWPKGVEWGAQCKARTCIHTASTHVDGTRFHWLCGGRNIQTSTSPLPPVPPFAVLGRGFRHTFHNETHRSIAVGVWLEGDVRGGLSARQELARVESLQTHAQRDSSASL